MRIFQQTSGRHGFVLQVNAMALEGVAVAGNNAAYESSMAPRSKVAGAARDRSDIRPLSTGSIPLPTSQVENQTTVDFEINTPYTVKSDNKNYSVDMAFYDLPAFYQYYCVPKIDKAAFLIANIVNWEKYNLMEGEANVFFEDTYLGKTLMDVRYASDTLEISLGRDKNISVNREKIIDFTNIQFSRTAKKNPGSGPGFQKE